jgi:hypothetical protein
MLARLPIYGFQVAITPAKAGGTFIAAHSPVKEPTAPVGFTPQAARATFFHLGTLYAEALATLYSNVVEATTQRLDVLVRVFGTVYAPRPLLQYLHAVQTLLHSQQYSGEELAIFLALFEPLYEEVYAGPNTRDMVYLFRAGAWVENVYLAAVAGDHAALRRGGAALEGVYRPLATLNLPPEILVGLERLHRLVQQQTLTAGELTRIQQLVQELQERFSE